MSSSDHSTVRFLSTLALIYTHPVLQISYEKEGLIHAPTGSHKVKYLADENWDFYLDTTHKPVDLSLVLPHYRARNQPIEHRMSMFVGNESYPIKLKVVRPFRLAGAHTQLTLVTVPQLLPRQVRLGGPRLVVRHNDMATLRLQGSHQLP